MAQGFNPALIWMKNEHINRLCHGKRINACGVTPNGLDSAREFIWLDAGKNRAPAGGPRADAGAARAGRGGGGEAADQRHHRRDTSPYQEKA